MAEEKKMSSKLPYKITVGCCCGTINLNKSLEKAGIKEDDIESLDIRSCHNEINVYLKDGSKTMIEGDDDQ